MRRITSLSILFAALIEFAIEHARFDLWIAMAAIITLSWNLVGRSLRALCTRGATIQSKGFKLDGFHIVRRKMLFGLAAAAVVGGIPVSANSAQPPVRSTEPFQVRSSDATALAGDTPDDPTAPKSCSSTGGVKAG